MLVSACVPWGLRYFRCMFEMLSMPKAMADEFLSCFMTCVVSSVVASISVIKWEVLFASVDVTVFFVFGKIADFGVMVN